jgi:hypothetical protein
MQKNGTDAGDFHFLGEKSSSVFQRESEGAVRWVSKYELLNL